MRNIMIRSQENGEMDYQDLRETLRIRRDAPPIIFANIGTTMKEGRDDISHLICMPHVRREQIDGLLADILEAYGSEDRGAAP